MHNLIFNGLNGEFKIAAATQYITRIKDSTNKLFFVMNTFVIQFFFLSLKSDLDASS